jgi:hypothetical protein
MLRRPNEAEADDADRTAANNRVRACLKKEGELSFFLMLAQRSSFRNLIKKLG